MTVSGEALYEKCAECHLFVEKNDVESPAFYCPTCKRPVRMMQEFKGTTGWFHGDDESVMCGTKPWRGSPTTAELNAAERMDFAAYIHLHRGDDADEAIDESHEAKPSGQIATLAMWREFGPPAMRARFDEADAIKNGLHDWQSIMAERCERCGEVAWGPYPTDVENAKQMVGPCKGTDDD